MTTEELKPKIIDLFQRNRQTPNADYNESRFLDYLLTPPAAKNTIKNSFKGVKRYYRFFGDVEQTFGICFTISDQDRFYSIDQFVKKTKDRIGNGRGNKMIIQQRLKEKKNYSVHVILTCILAIIAFAFRLHWVTALGIVGYSIAMHWIISSDLRSNRHNKKLNEIINAKK